VEGTPTVSARRLLVCCVNYAPEILGTAPYTRDLAEWFAGEGWDVRVVTTYPYYPEWRRRAGDPRFGYRGERAPFFEPGADGSADRAGAAAGSVTVWRCPTYVPAAPTGLRRLAHFASFAASSLPVLLAHAAWRPDYCLIVAPTLASAPGALLAARLAGACSWLHVQDYEVDVAIRLGLLPSAGRAALKRLEGALLRAFDAVSSITEPMLDAARVAGVPADRLVLLPNWARLDEVRPLDRPSRFRAGLGIDAAAPVVLYSGNLGLKQSVAVIGEAARCSQESGSPVTYVVSGDGADHESLDSRAAAYRLTNLLRLPLQPDGSFNELLNLADVHVVVQEAGVADLVMPSKVANMLASGRPVIATAARGTALARLVLENDVGLVVEPGDAQALARAVDDLAADVGRRARQGAKARSYAEAYLDGDRLLRAALAGLESRRCRG
jgi:colanic acid biosynthesis glycosyl transferase WcaI